MTPAEQWTLLAHLKATQYSAHSYKPLRTASEILPHLDEEHRIMRNRTRWDIGAWGERVRIENRRYQYAIEAPAYVEDWALEQDKRQLEWGSIIELIGPEGTTVAVYDTNTASRLQVYYTTAEIPPAECCLSAYFISKNAREITNRRTEVANMEQDRFANKNEVERARENLPYFERLRRNEIERRMQSIGLTVADLPFSIDGETIMTPGYPALARQLHQVKQGKKEMAIA